MKKIIILSIILCGFYTAYSQDLIREIQKLTLANDSLQKQVIKPLHDSILNLNSSKEIEVSKLQKKIKDLEKEKDNLNKKIKDFDKDIASLNKNKIKIEKDSLQKRVELLTENAAKLNLEIQGKNLEIQKINKQIDEEKQIGEQKAKSEKEIGKNEALTDIVNSYKNKEFDDLIKISTKLSVQRDMQFIGNNVDVKVILSDLEKYFNAEELLANKIDTAQIKNALLKLNQIKQKSELTKQLKENVKYYKDFNDELKKTIEKLIKLDDLTETIGDAAVQKLKFKDIVLELSNYMYDYYDYSNYPYLSDIILKIIKHKKPNADEDLSDLLGKLQ